NRLLYTATCGSLSPRFPRRNPITIKLEIHQLRIIGVEVLNVTAERVSELGQEQLHRLVGEIGGRKQLGCRAASLKKLHERSPDARAALARRHIEHLDHAVSVEGVRQHAIPDWTIVPLGDKALAGVYLGADVLHPPPVTLRHFIKRHEGVNVLGPRGPDLDGHTDSLQWGPVGHRYSYGLFAPPRS